MTSAPPPSGLLRRLSSSKKLPAPPAPPPAPPALSDDAHVDDLLHHVEMRERRLKAEDPRGLLLLEVKQTSSKRRSRTSGCGNPFKKKREATGSLRRKDAPSERQTFCSPASRAWTVDSIRWSSNRFRCLAAIMSSWLSPTKSRCSSRHNRHRTSYTNRCRATILGRERRRGLGQ